MSINIEDETPMPRMVIYDFRDGRNEEYLDILFSQMFVDQPLIEAGLDFYSIYPLLILKTDLLLRYYEDNDLAKQVARRVMMDGRSSWCSNVIVLAEKTDIPDYVRIFAAFDQDTHEELSGTDLLDYLYYESRLLKGEHDDARKSYVSLPINVIDELKKGIHEIIGEERTSSGHLNVLVSTTRK